MNENIGTRIKRLRLKKNMTQAELASKLNVSRIAITKWESDETKNLKHENLLGVCRVFNVSLEELLKGIDQPITRQLNSFSHANVEPAPKIVRQIPLISWVRAGQFCESPDNFHPGDAEEWFPSIKKHGPHTYALRVRGDSMVSPYPGSRSYEPNSIIYVDPDKPITNGCRVIAKIGDETTFKIYAEDSGKRYLRPLNPQYPIIEMTPDMMICGVVVGAWFDD